jgi:hypothetical protein
MLLCGARAVLTKAKKGDFQVKSVFLVLILSFAGVTAFAGDSAVEGLENLLQGRATMEGVFQVKCLPKNKILSLLSEEGQTSLRLIPTALCANEMHPVLFFFGVQNNLRARTAIATVEVSKSYNENVMLVLSVGLEGSDERFTAVPQIKVDSLAAYLFAQPYGGLNKHITYIERLATEFDIADFRGGPNLAKATWSVGSDVSTTTGPKVANFALLQPFFNDRVVALNHFFYNCFTFEWNFEMNRIASAKLDFDLMDGYIGQPFTGSYKDGLTLIDSPTGAFFASNDWTMGPPASCR